jgi:hypothetical protein
MFRTLDPLPMPGRWLKTSSNKLHSRSPVDYTNLRTYPRSAPVPGRSNPGPMTALENARSSSAPALALIFAPV